MTSKRPRLSPNRSYQVNVEDEIPLLRIHVVSARGLPRSASAVGMPDPYVIVKFNGDKVGATKADRATRRPEWNQNFLIRSDLREPTSPPAEGAGRFRAGSSSRGGDEGWHDRDDGNYCSCHGAWDHDEALEAETSTTSSPRWLVERKGNVEGDEVARVTPPRSRGDSGGGGGSSGGGNGSTCAACRRRGVDEVVLEVWDQYVREDRKLSSMGKGGSGGGGSGGGGGGGGADYKRRRSSISKPNDLFDDRLFDVSFVSRCFQKGALKRVQGAVIGGDRLIGACHISSAQLRALGASTVPADLKLRDPRGSWWSSSRGTIRVAVSLERLQANIIGAALEQGVGFPEGGTLGVGAGGVARAAVRDAKGEEGTPSAELSCKVLWNGHDFSSPSRWDKVFCTTTANNKLCLDVRAPPDLANSRGLSPTRHRPRRHKRPLTGGAVAANVGALLRATKSAADATTASKGSDAVNRMDEHVKSDDGVGSSNRSKESDGCTAEGRDAANAGIAAAAAAVSAADVAVVAAVAAAAVAHASLGATSAGETASASTTEKKTVKPSSPVPAPSTPPKPATPEEDVPSPLSTAVTTIAAAAAATIAETTTPTTVTGGPPLIPSPVTSTTTPPPATPMSSVAPPSPLAPSPVAAIAAAVATAAAAPAAVLLEGVLAVARSARPTIRRQRRPAVVETNWAGDRSCILTFGRSYRLSTFDAQGLADVLNSGEESTERMAGTKDWHEKGFRLHWDSVRRRFTILNVSRRSFVLRGGCSPLATELLGFGDEDHVSEPVPEAILDPQEPSDPPRKHMGVTAKSLPPPLLRPRWMRILWGPPAMEITKGGELRVQLWARQPAGSVPRSLQRRRRRRSALGGLNQSDDGSWLIGTAVLDSAEVCRLATGEPTKLPLLSPPALWKYERSKSAATAAAAAAAAEASSPSSPPTAAATSTLSTAAAAAATAAAAGLAASVASSPGGVTVPVSNGAGFWLAVMTAPRAFAWRQRQRLRRLKRRIAAAGGWDADGHNRTPVGVGGARICWVLPPPTPPARPSPSRWGAGSTATAVVAPDGSIVNTPVRDTRKPWTGDCFLGKSVAGSTSSGNEAETCPPAAGEGVAVGGEAAAGSGVVGHVWVSLKLRDPSMLMMRVVRQWNMARDELSVKQRRAAQLEAKRLWMFMPGISLWRVLVQLTGMSLLVSYCVTLTLRAYHSTSCRATFNCKEETDPKLASLREWQTLADNMLSALSFLDMLLQFRTGYVDRNSKIIINPKKVALHYLRTWFIPDLWCSLPYGTMRPLLQPLLDEVEGAADSLSSASADHVASAAVSESALEAADSPLSLWVFKLSKRLHFGKINGIRGTRAFKYLDDSAMGVDVAVKQVVQFVKGRQKVLKWLGNKPKPRGRVGKFFFRVGMTNKWTRIVLSYKLLGYAKVIGTLVRAMRVFAVAVRAVPRATRVLRLAAVFIRSYEGRRRSKDLHEASIVIQRRAGRHMALKVAGQLKTNLRRRTRARSESDIDTSSSGLVGGAAAAAAAAGASSSGLLDHDRGRVVSDAAAPPSSLGSGGDYGGYGGGVPRRYAGSAFGCCSAGGATPPSSSLSPSPHPVSRPSLERSLSPRRRRSRATSTPPRSPSLASDGGGGFGGSGGGGWGRGGRTPYPNLSRTPMSVYSSDNNQPQIGGAGESRGGAGNDNRLRSPSVIPSEGWSDCSWDEGNESRSPPRLAANWKAAAGGGGDVTITPISPSHTGDGAQRGGPVNTESSRKEVTLSSLWARLGRPQPSLSPRGDAPVTIDSEQQQRQQQQQQEEEEEEEEEDSARPAVPDTEQQEKGFHGGVSPAARGRSGSDGDRADLPGQGSAYTGVVRYDAWKGGDEA